MNRDIICPFVPGCLPDDAMAMVVAVEHPEGILLPELVQWLPTPRSARPIGIGAPARRQTAAIVTALIS